MVILQLKKIMVNSSASSTLNNSVSSPLHAVSATSTTCFEASSNNCKSSSPFLDSFSSTSMISSNELFKERLDLKKKKQLSLNNYQTSTPSPTLSVQLTPTTPTTPHSPSHHLSHSPINGKQPRSRMQTTGINLVKEKVIEEIPSIFDVCFASELKKESSTTTSVLESDELKHIQDALLAEYCKLRPVTVQVDREQRADKTTVCSMKPIISITLQLPPHINRKKRN